MAGATGFLWFRVSRSQALVVAVAGGVLGLIVAGSYRSKFNDGGMGTAIMIFYAIPFVFLMVGKAAGYFGLAVLPAGALVLFLSGEFRALRHGVGVSVLDLPYGRLRAGVLLLTLAPFVISVAGRAA